MRVFVSATLGLCLLAVPIAGRAQTAVTSVNGKSGPSVTLNAADVGAPNKSGDTYTGQHFIPLAGRYPANGDITQRIEGGMYLTGNGSKALGWPENTNYQHLFASTHYDTGSYYSLQFGGGMFDNNHFYARKTAANGAQPWRELWHSGNLDGAAPTDADSAAGTSTTKRPTVKQVGDAFNLKAPASRFYSYGGIGDGNSHPLSSVTSYNGQDTTGWTLAQWQAAFAGDVGVGRNPVTDLSNEADEVAIQAMANEVGVSNVTTVQLPAGEMRLTHPIQTSCNAVVVKGVGEYGTTLRQFGLNQDGWHHGTTDTLCPRKYGSRLEMEDLQFKAANFGGTAIKVAAHKGDAGYVFKSINIHYGAISSNDFWHDGIYLYDASQSSFYNVNIGGSLSSLAATGAGLFIDGDGTGNFEFNGGNIGGYSDCFLAYSGGPPADRTSGTGHGDVEGLSIIGANVGICLNGVRYIDNGSGQTGQFYSIGSQWGAIYGSLFDLPRVAEIALRDNLAYAQPVFQAGEATVTLNSNQITGQTYGNPAFPNAQVGQDVVALVNDTSVFPPGTTVTVVNGSTITVSAPATAPATSGGTSAFILYKPVVQLLGIFTSGSKNVTIDQITNDLQKGSPLDGNAAIPPGTTIESIDASTMTMTMSAQAASSASSAGFKAHYPPPTTFINMTDGFNNVLSGLSAEIGIGANLKYVGYFANNNSLTISDNNVRDFGTPMTRGWVDGGGNVSLVERNTNWNIWRPGIAHVGGAPFASGTGARWGSFYTDNGCDLGSSGLVTCHGAATVPTDAGSGVTQAIAVPPVFTSNPSVFAINGDFQRTRSACGLTGGHAADGNDQNQTESVALTSPFYFFTSACGSAPNTNVTIAWTATGK